MAKLITDIIGRIGETDQLYLNENTPTLALERADLRLQLVAISHLRQEQAHFLNEAIVLLETARVDFEEMPMSLYIDLSLHLAKAYMMYYEIKHEDKYALIAQQILKPLIQQDNGDIFFFLAYASSVRKEPSLAQHWLKKYAQTTNFDLELLRNHHAFDAFKQEIWFNQLIQAKLH